MKKNVDRIFNVVLGTAGHIDHGKSSLVKKLSGVDPDRLPEEQSRGLTIDLGFAPLTLPDGRRVGIVDVPGHERLIKNMVAGATGIDVVLLVIAADDGVMPQTREHLTIMQILGIQHGLVAITKIDLVDDDLRELVREEVKETLVGTFLDGAPVVEVSSVSGEGIDDLKEALFDRITGIQPRDSSGVFRMPIQRVFSPKGFGTVVTGIPLAGTTEIGATLEVVPLGERGRVRGIHAYKESTDIARAGHSTAINLTDIDYRQVSRGMVVTQPGYFKGATMFEARLHYLPSTRRPLLHQTAVRFHVGTTEALGKVFLLEKKKLDPGEESFVQFRFDEPVVAAPADRYVLRLHSPMETIGGGEVLDQSRWRLKAGKAFILDRLQGKQEALGDPLQFLVNLIDSAGYATVTEKELAVRCGRSPDEVKKDMEILTGDGRVQKASRPGQFVAVAQLEKARADALETASRYYEKHPRRLLMEKTYLQQQLKCTDVFLQDLLGDLRGRGETESADGGLIRWRHHEPKLTGDEAAIRTSIAEACRTDLFTPPSPDDLAQKKTWDPRTTEELYELLVEENELRKIADGIYFHREALEEARRRLGEYLRREGTITAADAKNLLASTRKYGIPLLEFLDREGFTIRRGDVRVLRNSEG